MSVRGQSYLAGLIGDGTTPSLTPPMHEMEADALGLRCIYRPIDLSTNGRSPADVGELVRTGADLGFSAFNITHPCKNLVVDALDELSEGAARLGAVNTVVVGPDGRLTGHNTDVTGFAWGLARALPDADLSRVVQLGTGGAGVSVAHALPTSGARHLTLVDLDAERCETIAAGVRAAFPDATVEVAGPADLPEALGAATGLVNATPVGMHQHPGTPLPPALLRPELWVADVVYRPLRTPLLEAARELGCAVMDGGWMATGQAIDAFELMSGQRPDPERLRGHFLRLVAAEG
ncbi:shikimate dehydrogenase [Agilicoccus flavus]|uniref:shikimate dehydrogenase n=1 Tax=Agilicoccus flavus TaxID=2775968 RepID=UPI001CF6A235|nr:shikimate dehydrogenase [Agilicoccus flavus]